MAIGLDIAQSDFYPFDYLVPAMPRLQLSGLHDDNNNERHQRNKKTAGAKFVLHGGLALDKGILR